MGQGLNVPGVGGGATLRAFPSTLTAPSLYAPSNASSVYGAHPTTVTAGYRNPSSAMSTTSAQQQRTFGGSVYGATPATTNIMVPAPSSGFYQPPAAQVAPSAPMKPARAHLLEVQISEIEVQMPEIEKGYFSKIALGAILKTNAVTEHEAFRWHSFSLDYSVCYKIVVTSKPHGNLACR